MSSNTIPVLNAEQVAATFERIDVLGELRRMFEGLGRDQAVQPAQTLTLFPDDKGDFITYMGAVDDASEGVFGAKLSPYLITSGRPIITAWTLLMSMKTGQPMLLCDSGQLTTERTAGTTALAVDYLAAEGVTKLAIIGAGAVAQAHYRHVTGLRDWQSVSVYSPSLATDPARRAAWEDLSPSIQVAGSPEDAAAGADVVLLCTSSGIPVIDSDAIGSDTLVTSISTNVAKAHEIDPAWLNGAQVYCDYSKTTPSAAGEMVLAAEQHGWSSDQIRGDLPGLATGTSPKPRRGKPVFFRSIGLGLEDIAAARAVVAAL